MLSTEKNEYLAYPALKLTNAQLLQVYLSICVLANFACLFFNGHGGDLGFWFNWINQLTSNGYTNFNADYPPLYVHWIYAVSKIIPAIGTTLENNNLLKTLLELPSIACHLILVATMNKLLEYRQSTRQSRHLILLFTALNPAILFNGPIWGQVDVIPVTFALIAILIHFSPHFRMLSIPFYILALLTKFQMICFAPIMGILFFRHIKSNIVGILISLLVFAAAFSPFILQNYFIQYFKQAYINTLGQYAYTTFNASNLWMLITANTMPDSHIMFNILEGTNFEKPVNAKHLGMILFSLVSLIVFIRGVYEQASKKMGDNDTQISKILFFSLICALAFFTLLPAMHERYLFPAVILSLAYATVNPRCIMYAVIITLICFINMALINGINGSNIWWGLSILCVFTLLFSLLEFFIGGKLYFFLNDAFTLLSRIRWLGLWTFIACSYLVIHTLIQHEQVFKPTLNDQQQLLTDLPYSSATQNYGTLQINKSVDSHPLSIGGKHFAYGLGTHTVSHIIYNLPPGATRFEFMVGVDNEAGGSSDMQFSVWGDGKKLWESPVYYGYEDTIKTESIDITNIRELILHVDPVSGMSGDHADWINPIITFDHKVR